MPTPSTLAETLKALEERLLEPEIRQSPERVSALLADDFLEIGASGRTFNKEQVLLHLSAEAPLGGRKTIADFQARNLSETLALVIYRIVESNTLRSSLWRKDPSGWRIIFHQGTKASDGK